VSNPDDSQALSIEEPFPADPAQTPQAPDDDAEPDGAVEVAPGRRMVDVSIVAAERKRTRDATEKRVRDTEVEPLKQQAGRVAELEAALNAARPYVELIQQNQHLLNQQPRQTPEEQVSDQEAEQEARELQLYKGDSTLDIPTAKKIIARRRQEAYQAGQYAAQEAVAPMRQMTAKQASDMNFVRMVQMTDDAGHPLIDPQLLAQEWVALGPEMTQHAEVAEVVLERAIGKSLRTGKRSMPNARGPVLSESAGGGSGAAATKLTDLARRVGLTETDLKTSQKTFNPGGVSAVGDW
jgi:hypothetical protein